MGFFNNVKARFRGNEERQYEEEFERAFREGNWPEGVDDFAPLATTGSFLPQTYDVDPLADETLPGNVMRAAASRQAYGQYADEYDDYDMGEDVGYADVQQRGSSVAYAQPAPSGPLGASSGPAAGRVSDSVIRQPAAFGVQGGFGLDDQPTNVQPAVEQDDVFAEQPRNPRPARVEEPEPDDGVHVFARRGDERTPRPAPTPQAAPRPFADRLRERVAAAAGSVARPGYEEPRQRYATRDDQRDDVRRAYARDDEREYGDSQATDRRRMRRTPAADRDVYAADERAPRSAGERRERVRDAAGERDWGRADVRGRAPIEREPLERPAYEDAPAARTRGADRPAREPQGERPAARPAAAPAPARPVPVSCIVLRPRNYDAVSEIAQGVIGEQRPTVLVLRGCNNELIRRVLDFSFGLCCASGAGMREFGDRVYAILPKNTTLTDEDMVAMRRQGILKG